MNGKPVSVMLGVVNQLCLIIQFDSVAKPQCIMPYLSINLLSWAGSQTLH